jgi:transposase
LKHSSNGYFTFEESLSEKVVFRHKLDFFKSHFLEFTPVSQSFETVSLNLKGLVQTPLAKSFSDAGIGETIGQLEYKAIEVGGAVQKVDHFFPSSKLCSACGQKNESLTLSDREWLCVCVEGMQCLSRQRLECGAEY